MGAATACGRDVVTFAFGVVAMVAMTPLITIQILGLMYKIKAKAAEKERRELIEAQLSNSDILEMEVEE